MAGLIRSVDRHDSSDVGDGYWWGKRGAWPRFRIGMAPIAERRDAISRPFVKTSWSGARRSEGNTDRGDPASIADGDKFAFHTTTAGNERDHDAVAVIRLV